MRHQTINPIQAKEELITNFTGYNHTLPATEGSYFDMQNMSSDYYPAMSPRKKRASDTASTITGVKMADYLAPNNLFLIQNKTLYENSNAVTGQVFSAYNQSIVIHHGNPVFFPDKLIYKGGIKHLDNEVSATESISFTLCLADGTSITWHDEAYYENNPPQNGDYKMETLDGKTGLYVYSASASYWSPVATTYIKIQGSGIAEGFNKGDAVKITVDLTGITWDYAKNIFVNDEANGKRSNTFVIEDLRSPITPTDHYLIVPAILDENKTFTLPITISRKCPDMDFVIECQNRLWGCSSYKNEIYCCKLGDPFNWNVFQGISTDSWAVTLGSVGRFTGAISYQGHPVFFKEHSIITISISSTGGHSMNEVQWDGVGYGCEKSLVELNNRLYYLTPKGFRIYDGSYPIEVPDVFGDEKKKYTAFLEFSKDTYVLKQDVVLCGAHNDRYYVLLKEIEDDTYNSFYTMFVYDTRYGIWNKEDRIKIKKGVGKWFVNSDTDLYLVTGNSIYSIEGTNMPRGSQNPITLYKESSVDWFIESNNIGYLYTGKSYRSRINNKQYIQKMIMQVSLAVESHISVYINYDSSDEWEFLYNFSGSNANLCKIPIRPHRCNHFRYKIVGHGDAKIFSITKYYTEGSDV